MGKTSLQDREEKIKLEFVGAIHESPGGIFRRTKRECHCEPSRTTVWQSASPGGGVEIRNPLVVNEFA